MSIDRAHKRAIAQLSALKRDLSPQEQQARNGKSQPTCPLCDKRFRWRRPRYRRPDGAPADWVNAIGGHHVPAFVLDFAGVAVAECARCGGQWPVFAGAGLEVIEETSRRELGDLNTKTIHNSDTAAVRRTTTITHRWRQSLNLAYGEDIGVGIELKMSAEREVKKHYDLTLETELEETEQIAVEVDPGKVSTITWQPEYVWRHGIVRMPYGKPIPYDARVAVNVVSHASSSPS
jgi:hypothetical protein